MGAAASSSKQVATSARQVASSVRGAMSTTISNGENQTRQKASAGEDSKTNYPPDFANTGDNVTGDSKHGPTEKADKHSSNAAASADENVRVKMASLMGDGGVAGLELEDGQAVSMRRGVRNNMFRYI